jgi:hypothetical protein
LREIGVPDSTVAGAETWIDGVERGRRFVNHEVEIFARWSKPQMTIAMTTMNAMIAIAFERRPGPC